MGEARQVLRKGTNQKQNNLFENFGKHILESTLVQTQMKKSVIASLATP